MAGKQSCLYLQTNITEAALITHTTTSPPVQTTQMGGGEKDCLLRPTSSYPIPRIDAKINEITRYRIFSTLDQRNAIK